MTRRALALLSFIFATSAYAAPQYIFGFSTTNGGNSLNINGSTALQFVDQGWYFEGGQHTTSNDNYIVGLCDICGLNGEYRNWFAVSLAGITQPVTSVSLRLFSYDVTLTSGNYYLNDYTGFVSSLINGTGGVAAFNDLGSGVNYGFRFYQDVESNQYHTIDLNAGAVASLNAAISNGQELWALGGSFAPGDVPVPPSNSVPEPATLGMTALGMGLLALMTRRRRIAALANC